MRAPMARVALAPALAGACGAALLLGDATTEPASAARRSRLPPEVVFPFARSPQQRQPRRRSLPRFWADGRSCSTGCRPAGARAGWPLRPFHSQHALRAGLNERRDTTFHVGVDIQAYDHQKVYSMQSGRARVLTPGGVEGKVQVGNFIYWHIVPAVRNGQWVRKYSTVVGRIYPTARHLHLSEVRGKRFLNPLRPRGRVLSPWRERTPPVIGRPRFGTRGRVTVQVFDPQTFRVRTDYETPVLMPAALAYRVFTPRGRRVGRMHFAYRGSQHLFWTPGLSRAIWARGARKAGWGCHQAHVICKPNWHMVLAGGLAPRIVLRRGLYRLTMYAWDWAGNVSARDDRFVVLPSGRLRPTVDRVEGVRPGGAVPSPVTGAPRARRAAGAGLDQRRRAEGRRAQSLRRDARRPTPVSSVREG